MQCNYNAPQHTRISGVAVTGHHVAVTGHDRNQVHSQVLKAHQTAIKKNLLIKPSIEHLTHLCNFFMSLCSRVVETCLQIAAGFVAQLDTLLLLVVRLICQEHFPGFEGLQSGSWKPIPVVEENKLQQNNKHIM